jgi:hypothetical protein
LIDASFATGEISYSKVRAMTRVATPETEEALLEIARHGTASHMEQLVSKYKRVKRNMQDEAEQEREASRKLSYYQDNDGMWVINARLSPEAGSLLVKAIEALVAPIQEEKREQLLEQRLQEAAQEEKGVSAETFSEAVDKEEEENVSAETFSEAIEKEDPNHFYKLIQHTRADALVTLAEHFLATCGEKADFRGLKGSERCQVMLHVDINTLRQRSGEDCDGEQHCHLDEKPWVSAQTARRLSCDASLVTVLEDENGKVLNIGRRIETDLFPQFPPHVAQTAEEALQQAAPEVDATTCVTRWQGEPCDYGMAIEGLLRRDGSLNSRGELGPDPAGSVRPQ